MIPPLRHTTEVIPLTYYELQVRHSDICANTRELRAIKKPMRLQRTGLLIFITRRLGSRPPSVCKSAKDLLTAYAVGTSRKGALHGDA